MKQYLNHLQWLWSTRQRWKWVSCQSHEQRDCCHGGYGGPDDSEFMGCQADHYNDWVASRWYRRWVANAREFMAKGGLA